MEITAERLQRMAAGFQAAKVLMTANELGIFKEIGDGGKSAARITKALKLDPEATRLLLGALVGLEVLEYGGGRFWNAPDVKKYLAGTPEDSLACITTHMNHMFESWTRLDGIVKTGRPRKTVPPKMLTDRKKNREFICGMFEIGFGTAKLLADELDMTGVTKMADIGGGPAQYPIAIGLKYTDIKFVVADYPNTISVAREYVERYGMRKRIKLVKSEFFDAQELGIGDGFDMALLSQVLHTGSVENCIALIEKTARILRPGGRIVINENALEDDGMRPAPPLVFAINMLVNNEGRSYTVKEMTGWLRKAGFKKIESDRLHERSVVISGRKP